MHNFIIKFLPRDAMLARYMLWPCVCMCLCVCLCLSVTSRNSTKTAQWIELIFGMDASFHLSYTAVLQENSGNPKIRGLPSGTLSQTLDLETFATAVGRR